MSPEELVALQRILNWAGGYGITINSIVHLDLEGERSRIEVTFPGHWAMTWYVQGFNESVEGFFLSVLAALQQHLDNDDRPPREGGVSYDVG